MRVFTPEDKQPARRVATCRGLVVVWEAIRVSGMGGSQFDWSSAEQSLRASLPVFAAADNTVGITAGDMRGCLPGRATVMRREEGLLPWRRASAITRRARLSRDATVLGSRTLRSFEMYRSSTPSPGCTAPPQ